MITSSEGRTKGGNHHITEHSVGIGLSTQQVDGIDASLVGRHRRDVGEHPAAMMAQHDHEIASRRGHGQFCRWPIGCRNEERHDAVRLAAGAIPSGVTGGHVDQALLSPFRWAT